MATPAVDDRYSTWANIVDSVIADHRNRAELNLAQRQMLVYDLREVKNMSHRQAISVADVSDKGGKNGVRIAKYAASEVADVIRSGLTSINDGMQMLRYPAEVQRAAAAELEAGEVSYLSDSSACAEYDIQQYDPNYGISAILADGCFLDDDILESMLHRLQTKQNIILQGPPGTGKTWLSKRLAYALIGRKDDDKVRQVQFHPNLSYEDFVRGWRPDGEGGLVLADGPFLKLAEDARNDPDGKYVMVIEEINRGNPASIFGELLTLLEADKRSHNDALALAYPRDDGERFHIPPNVYVIGTMNLADRSLALVDFALRRRFAFFDLEPMLNDDWRDRVHEQKDIPAEFLDNIAQRIITLNDQIAADRNLGPQFRIGHSHLTPSHDKPIEAHTEWFTEIVETEIAPLLREYWFDDPARALEESDKLVAGL